MTTEIAKIDRGLYAAGVRRGRESAREDSVAHGRTPEDYARARLGFLANRPTSAMMAYNRGYYAGYRAQLRAILELAEVT